MYVCQSLNYHDYTVYHVCKPHMYRERQHHISHWASVSITISLGQAHALLWSGKVHFMSLIEKMCTGNARKISCRMHTIYFNNRYKPLEMDSIFTISCHHLSQRDQIHRLKLVILTEAIWNTGTGKVWDQFSAGFSKYQITFCLGRIMQHFSLTQTRVILHV